MSRHEGRAGFAIEYWRRHGHLPKRAGVVFVYYGTKNKTKKNPPCSFGDASAGLGNGEASVFLSPSVSSFNVGNTCNVPARRIIGEVFFFQVCNTVVEETMYLERVRKHSAMLALQRTG